MKLTHAHVTNPTRRPRHQPAHCAHCVAVRRYVLAVTAERWGRG